MEFCTWIHLQLYLNTIPYYHVIFWDGIIWLYNVRKFLILMDKTKQKQFSHSSTFQYSRNLQHPNLPVITIFKNVNDDASINNVHVDFILCILQTLLKLAYLYIYIYTTSSLSIRQIKIENILIKMSLKQRFDNSQMLPHHYEMKNEVWILKGNEMCLRKQFPSKIFGILRSS